MYTRSIKHRANYIPLRSFSLDAKRTIRISLLIWRARKWSNEKFIALLKKLIIYAVGDISQRRDTLSLSLCVARVCSSRARLIALPYENTLCLGSHAPEGKVEVVFRARARVAPMVISPVFYCRLNSSTLSLSLSGLHRAI